MPGRIYCIGDAKVHHMRSADDAFIWRAAFGRVSGSQRHSYPRARPLTQFAPDKEPELLQRTRLVAYDRVSGGEHDPTDLAAGMSLGSLIAEEIVKSPVFRAELQAARGEWVAH